MRYLLDTNIFIYAAIDRDSLSKDVIAILEDYDNTYPSDHIIIAHAITNRMPLISSDHKFKFYTKQGLDLIFNKK